MTDPIRELAETVAALRREVHALATAPRAPFTSVRGGFTRWMPEGEAENPKVFIGQTADGGVALVLNDATGGPGEVFIGTNGGVADVIVSNPEGLTVNVPALRVFGGKVIAPLVATAWQKGSNVTVDASGRPTTTSASYAELWQTVLPVTSGAVDTLVDVFPGVGNTASVRITCTPYRSGVTPAVVAEMTGITTTALLSGQWTVPNVQVPAESPIGLLYEFRIEALRSAGAGVIAVAPRTPLVNRIS